MAGNKRDRQRANRQARLAELAAARKREARKRRLTVGGAGALGLVLIVFLVSLAGGDDKPAAAPVKPCVAVADPLPAGAPAVDVQVGPPPTQLVIRDLKVGEGATVAAGANVTANYIGVACSTGKIFDSSYSRGSPTPFPLSGVIKGWQDGLVGMKVGGQRLLGIPSDQAYGPQGSSSGGIGPDEALWFVVEIVDTQGP